MDIPVRDRDRIELPGAVEARGSYGDGNSFFEALEGPNDEGPVGPGASEAHVEVKKKKVKVVVVVGVVGYPEFRSGSRVTAGGIGGGELGHHELPRGVPGCTDGGD